jgi:hypothetical protein
MGETYEEIRGAAIDVLANRVPLCSGINQYVSFQDGVARALDQRRGIQDYSHGSKPHLNRWDSGLFLEVFWDLFREGIITLGIDDANREFPFFRLSSLGKRIVEGESQYFVHDVSEYEKRIKTEVPAIDNITLLYLKEALQAFRSGCILSATVMLGVATEHTFMLVLDVAENNPSREAKFSTISKERTILQRVNKFRKLIEPELPNFPSELKEDWDTNFSGILSIIRNFRNESGHPTGKIIGREQAYVLLQLFLPYCKKMYQLKSYLANDIK